VSNRREHFDVERPLVLMVAFVVVTTTASALRDRDAKRATMDSNYQVTGFARDQQRRN
jgi:hypothetical protein